MTTADEDATPILIVTQLPDEFFDSESAKVVHCLQKVYCYITNANSFTYYRIVKHEAFILVYTYTLTNIPFQFVHCLMTSCILDLVLEILYNAFLL